MQTELSEQQQHEHGPPQQNTPRLLVWQQLAETRPMADLENILTVVGRYRQAEQKAPLEQFSLKH